MQSLMQTQEKFLFKDEKINTVIVIIMVIWIGIAAYLLVTGRKVSRLEHEVKNLQQRWQSSEAGTKAETTIEVKRRES